VPKKITLLNKVTKISFSKRFSGSKKGVEKAARILSTDSPAAIVPVKHSVNLSTSSPIIPSKTSPNNVDVPTGLPEIEKSPIATSPLKFTSIMDQVPNPEERSSNITFKFFRTESEGKDNSLDIENLPTSNPQTLMEDLTKNSPNFVAGYTEDAFLVVNSNGTIDSIKADEPHARLV